MSERQDVPVVDFVLKKIYDGQRAMYPTVASDEWYASLLTHLQRSNDRRLKEQLSGILAQHARFMTRHIAPVDSGDVNGEQAMLSSLRTRGYAVTDLPGPVTEALKNNAALAPFANPRKPDDILSLDDVLNDAERTAYSTSHASRTGASNILHYPAIALLASNPLILNTLEQYFGALPQVGGYEITANVAGREGMVPSSDWHADKGSIAFVKMFVYLSDVGGENGPHGFIAGSHTADGISAALNQCDRLTPEQKELLINNQRWEPELIDLVFPGKTVFYGGAAGTAILEDTRGFHRAHRLKSGHRLMLALQWCLDPSTLYETDRVSFDDLPDELHSRAMKEEARFRYVFQRYLK